MHALQQFPAAVSCSTRCTFLHQFPAAAAHLSLLQLGLSLLALLEELADAVVGLVECLEVCRLEGLALVLLLLLQLLACSLQGGSEAFTDSFTASLIASRLRTCKAGNIMMRL